jgi:hypothetical protein
VVKATCMLTLFWITACVVSFFMFVAVHETGIPRRDMRIRLLAFPQHVALYTGEKWVAPAEFEPYLAKMQACLPTVPRMFLYTAGGFVFETVFVAAACVIALALGYKWIALVVGGMSLWLLASYILFMDLPGTLRYKVPCGDLSGLWWIKPWAAVSLAMAMFAVRVPLVWAAMG